MQVSSIGLGHHPFTVGSGVRFPVPVPSNASVAKLADAADLGSAAARRGGSSPLARTIGSIGVCCF